MASNFDVEPISGATCTICLDVKGIMKIVGICKHFFCVDCLEKHFDRQKPGSGVFPCPTCQGECAVPNNGVDGLVDHSPSVDDENVTRASPDAVEPSSREPGTFQPICQMCEFTNKSSSKADFVCKKCDLLMCRSCNEQHQNTLANAQHVVMRLASNTETEDKCARHRRPLQLHCNTCQCPVCSVCVTLEHGDHEVMEMELVISQVIKEVKSKIENSSDKVADFQQLKAEVTAARELILNWRGKMIQQVEEAAEEVINRVLEQKEKQKQEIKDGCDVNELTDLLERLNNAEKSFQKEIRVGQGLLNETSTTPIFLDRLKTERTDLDVIIASDDIGRDDHWKRLKTPLPLFQRNEDKEKLDLGEIINGGSDKVRFLKCQNLVYQDTRFIQCIAASVGVNDYAIAVGCTTNQQSARLFYLFDHSFNKLNDKCTPIGVDGVQDMSVTLCSRLAILQQDDLKNDKKFIKIVSNINNDEPLTDAIPILTNSRNAKCISLSVNICGQFVVLWANDQERKQITVLSDKGHTIDEQEAQSKNLRRVGCGGRYFFVLGEADVYVYEMKRGKVVNVGKFGVAGDVDDISATPSGDLFASISDRDRVYVVKLDFLDTIGGFRKRAVKQHVLTVTNRTGESRVDVQDNWMIVSHGYKFDVYNLKTEKYYNSIK